MPEYDTQGQLKHVLHAFPKSMTNGQKMLLRGKGGKGFHDGKDGNLYLSLVLSESII